MKIVKCLLVLLAGISALAGIAVFGWWFQIPLEYYALPAMFCGTAIGLATAFKIITIIES